MLQKRAEGAMKTRRLLLLVLVAAALWALPGSLPGTGARAGDEIEEQGRRVKRNGEDRFCLRQAHGRTHASKVSSRSQEKSCLADGGQVRTRQQVQEGDDADARDAVRRLGR